MQKKGSSSMRKYFYVIRISCFICFGLFAFSCKDEEPEPSSPETNSVYQEKYRPQIHFSSKKNWINDPNGMVYLDREYHLFFQYNPLRSTWGNMSWGHAVSTDLIYWEQLSVALMPDNLGDIFSGCAVVDKNNTAGFGANALIAVYTSSGTKQTQCLAYSLDKGRTFNKYVNNPVLSNSGITDFRDPKVFWHEASNQWIMALATSQTITFYSSENLKKWDKLSSFGEGIGSHGGVWECPDLFPLNFDGEEKWVLLVSNAGAPNGGTATQYFIGSFDGVNFTADEAPYPLWMDYGRDNYAGVTWSNLPDPNRRILIGWMNNWDYANEIPSFPMNNANGARGAMTLPRDLSIARHPDGHLVLCNKIVDEINNIASGWESFSPKPDVETALNLNDKKAYQLQVEMEPASDDIVSLVLSNQQKEFVVIELDKQLNQLIFNRNNSENIEISNLFRGSFRATLPAEMTKIKIDIYVDQSSIEVFLNDGLVVQTNLVFPETIYNFVRVEGNISNTFIYKIRTFDSIWQ